MIRENCYPFASLVVLVLVLAYANVSQPFILKVDVHYCCLGAPLSQQYSDDRVRSIAYASWRLKPSECKMSNYSSRKLEFLTLQWAKSSEDICWFINVVFTKLTIPRAFRPQQTLELLSNAELLKYPPLTFQLNIIQVGSVVIWILSPAIVSHLPQWHILRACFLVPFFQMP